MKARPHLSVIIPAYNERERLKRFIPGIVEFLQSKGWPFEIIVVNDGSKDDTATVALKLSETFPMLRLIDLQPNRGKGSAVKAGMLEACGEYALFTDADQSTPISEMGKLLDKIERDGFDMAIGSRSMPGARVEQSQVWCRALAGKLFSIGTKALCIYGLQDTQCGFKAMKRGVAQRVFSQVRSNTAVFDVEMLVVATREGYRIAEVAVKWTHDPDTRMPYNLRRAVRIWVELFRIKRAQNVVWPLQAKTN